MKGTTEKTISSARRLRRDMTDAERRLWSKLRGNALGVSFRRQHPVGPYILDFFCERHGLAVELDGGQHAESSDRDTMRTEWLARNGIVVVRFWNNDVSESLEGVVERIRDALAARTEVQWRRPWRSRPTPPT